MDPAWTRWFSIVQDQAQHVNISNPNYDYIVSVEGFTYLFANNTSLLIIDGTDVNDGAVTCPKNPVQGQLIRISSTVIVNNFTVTANVNQSVKGGAVTLVPRQVVAYTYRAENKTWYPT